MIVVLCNGQPWGTTYPMDPEFQFGKTKALMILAVRDLLDEFNRTEGRDAAQIQRELPNAPGLTRPLLIQGFAGFIGRGERFVDKPYLKLECGRTNLSLGVNKTHALLSVWQDIVNFTS